MTDKQYILCIAVDEVPNFPEFAPYSRYEKIPCHGGCERLIWLGERAGVKVKQGAVACCIKCAVTKYGIPVEQLQNATKLTDRDL